MKNIHILSIDEQIKNVGDVVKDLYGDIHIFTKKNEGKEYVKTITKLNIYITSDEEIKEGDWIFDIVTKKIEIAKFNHNDLKRDWKKIILTTDQDLIKDGVQAIDYEFLEWFVKNPSCQEVEVEYGDDGNGYQPILPKEKTKQETTLEEVLGSSMCQFSVIENKLAILYRNQVKIYEAITKEQERMYSEEEVIAFGEFIFKNTLLVNVKGVEGILKQFKKK